MFYKSRSLAVVLILLATQLVGITLANGSASQPLNCDDLLAKNLELANRGDAAAQRTLGGIYLNGYCIDKDYRAAINWYEKAAQAGDGEAMLALGNIYARGYGVVPNLEQTLKWLKLAEDNGQITGRVYAFLYLDGVLVSKSIGRAYSFFLQAAEAGDPAAQYTVSMEYFRGQHLAKNPAQALAWLTRSAENGYGPAYRVLGGIYAYGSYGIARDNAKAGKWLALAKDQNKATALDVAEMYLEGRGVNRDYDKAIEYYTELAEQYVAEAHLKLGMIYSHGPPLTPNYELAEAHFQMAEVLGSAEAAYHLGLLRLNGQGMPADRAAAQSMFELAAQNGYVFANYYLGLLAYNRPGGGKNLARAHELFGKAAATPDPDLAAQALEARDAAAIELGLFAPTPDMDVDRLDRWSGSTPGAGYVYAHRPRKKLIPPLVIEATADSSGRGKARQPAPSVRTTYDPPPPPLLPDVPGGNVNSVDGKIDPVF
jgi:TPR repeat protein